MTLPAAEGSSMYACMMQMGHPHAVQGADGMHLSGQAQLMLETTSGQGIPMATALQVGDVQEQDASCPSLILCRLGSESLWNLAKRCGSTMAVIRKANGLEEEPTADRMLVIPVI